MANPKTLEEARAKRYNKWGGNPDGDDYCEGDCAGTVYDITSGLFYQCTRKNGRGPTSLYCWQHAEKVGD